MRCRVELGKEDIPPLMRSNEVWGYVGYPYRRKSRFAVELYVELIPLMDQPPMSLPRCSTTVRGIVLENCST